jgi:hypothetical protein
MMRKDSNPDILEMREISLHEPHEDLHIADREPLISKVSPFT